VNSIVRGHLNEAAGQPVPGIGAIISSASPGRCGRRPRAGRLSEDRLAHPGSCPPITATSTTRGVRDQSLLESRG